MKHLSLLKTSIFTCGIMAVAAMVSSCGPTLTPEKAAHRLAQSPVTSVFSHNDVNSPKLRDCYEAGPLPERAERALITWLHNSTLREFSYVYPQYYVSTTNKRGGSEVVWALCSDGQGNLVGVLAPANKHVPAWDLPTIGSYMLFVCNTPERKALSDAIMESLADAGYDKVRIDTRKAMGVSEKRHLISAPLNAAEQQQIEQERKAREKAEADAKKQAKAAAAEFSSSSGDDEDNTDEDESDTGSDDSSSSDDDTGDSGSSDDDASDDSSTTDDDSSLDDEE